MRYDESSHKKRWQFASASEVGRLREEANARSRREAISAIQEHGVVAVGSGEEGGEESKSEEEKKYQPLTCEQEELLRRFFLQQMGKV